MIVSPTYIIEKLVNEVILQNKFVIVQSLHAMYLKSVFRNLARSIVRKCLVKEEIVRKAYPKNFYIILIMVLKRKKIHP